MHPGPAASVASFFHFWTMMRPRSIAQLMAVAMAVSPAANAMTEDFRMEQYHKRGYTYPPSHFLPDTAGWKYLSSRRFEQAEHMPLNHKHKYDLWLQSVTSSLVQPNFTATGWGLMRAPQELADTLRREVRGAYEAGDYRLEHNVDVITGDQALFVSRPSLTKRVLHELLPMHEAWAGIKLHPYTAYGFRLYRNESSLYMHVDKPDTHIISCIFHIDSSDDAEDWPIVIEDYQGNTNEVVLAPGDMLFYESSKCFHGRPSKFVGSWYSSVFVHYHPADPEWMNSDRRAEGHYAVPAHWREVSSARQETTPAHVVGTGLIEPDCDRNWCLLGESVRWRGPAEEGVVLTTNGHKYPLFPSDGDGARNLRGTVGSLMDDEEEEEL